MLIRSLKLQDHFVRIPAERLKALTCCSRQYDPVLKAQQWRAFLTSTHHAKWFLVLYPHPINTNLHIHILSILTPLSIQHILRVEVVCSLLCARDITVKYQLPSLTTLCVVVHVYYARLSCAFPLTVTVSVWSHTTGGPLRSAHRCVTANSWTAGPEPICHIAR